MHHVMGISKDMCMGTFEHTIDNLERALLERMYFTKMKDGTFEPPLKPQQKVLDELRSFICAVAKSCKKLQPLSLDEVVESYSGPKRTRYAIAKKLYEFTGYLKKYSYITMFVKGEKSNLAKPPRGIQPRHPVYNLLLARYLKHAEHHIYDAIGRVFGGGIFNATIMKCYNALEIGNIIAEKWYKFKDPVGIGADATKFDMHVSASMLAIEHELYNMIFNSPELARLLRDQRRTTGYATAPDGTLKYTVNGCRCSGDLNTSLGNCIIMCAMMWTWAKKCGVKVELINNGDDCMIFMERSDLEKFRHGALDFFTACGFRMVFEEPVYELPKVEFCQSRPIRTRDGVLMVRNIPTVLSKDTMTTLDLTDRATREQWFYAIGDCGLSMYGDIPVLREFYNTFSRFGRYCDYRKQRHFQVSGRHYESRGMHKKYSTDIIAETVFDIWVAWGITPHEQAVLEEHYHRVDLSCMQNIGEIPNDRSNYVQLPY